MPATSCWHKRFAFLIKNVNYYFLFLLFHKAPFSGGNQIVNHLRRDVAVQPNKLYLSIDIDLDKYRDNLLILRSKIIPISDDMPEIDLRIEIGDKWKSSSLFFYQNIKKDCISIWNKKEPIF